MFLQIYLPVKSPFDKGFQGINLFIILKSYRKK